MEHTLILLNIKTFETKTTLTSSGQRHEQLAYKGYKKEIIPTCSGILIRSPLIRVNTLLSSMTEFIDSIHNVSTGASNKIHFSSDFSSDKEYDNFVMI